MKKLMLLVLVSVLGGAITLGSYKLFFDDSQNNSSVKTALQKVDNTQNKTSHTTYVSHNRGNNINPEKAPDFVSAAKKTVPAVVHVKNVEVRSAPRNISEYLRGIRAGKFVRGMGSGVIITPDGYIVTNNHVIEGANELKVTLNNNLTYKAKVIGSDPQADIALLKIDADNLPYLPFGDSNQTEVGQWVLAVGNPFNLTSTVTAGIVSAKGRNLDENGQKMESFIQTDAAINPGNSGGALVNENGELIGINAAITSRTGSYIGYSFAIPSNNARKIVEDLMEYGDVKQAIIGIRGNTINPKIAKEREFSVSQGVHIAEVSDGAKKAGLQPNDLITKVDGIKIKKMSDLSAYIQTKRPGEKVQVNYIRNGKEHLTKIKLTEYETFILNMAGLEIVNADETYLKHFNTTHGVRIARSVTREMQIPQDQFVITAINGKTVNSVADVKRIIKHRNKNDDVRITFQNQNGQSETVRF